MKDEIAPYEAFRFANHLWLDKIANWRNPRKALLIILLISLAPYLMGLAISSSYGLLLKYIKTPGFALGSAGLFLTLTVISYGSIAQYRIFDRLLKCFEFSELERQEYTLKVIERHSNFKQQLRASLIVLLVGVAMLYFSTSHQPPIHPSTRSMDVSFPIISSFHKYGWYDMNAIEAFKWIALSYIVFLAPALGTSSSVIIRLPRLLWDVSRRNPVFPPALIKVHFAPAARFYVIVSVSWLIGGLMIAYLLVHNRDPTSLIILGFVFSVGMVNFLLPQASYVRTIDKSEENYLNHLSSIITRGDNRDRNTFPFAALDEETRGRAELVMNMTRHDHWVYPLHHTYGLGVIYLVSIIGSFISIRHDNLLELVGL